jgi:hypothetical protein
MKTNFWVQILCSGMKTNTWVEILCPGMKTKIYMGAKFYIRVCYRESDLSFETAAERKKSMKSIFYIISNHHRKQSAAKQVPDLQAVNFTYRADFTS